MSGQGSVYKRCGCADPVTGRQLGNRCPRVAGSRHGSWYIGLELPTGVDGRRRRVRRGGYPSRAAAAETLAALRSPRPGDRAGQVLTTGDWLAQWLASRTSPAVAAMASDRSAASMSWWSASRRTPAKSRSWVLMSPRATMVTSFSASAARRCSRRRNDCNRRLASESKGTRASRFPVTTIASIRPWAFGGLAPQGRQATAHPSRRPGPAGVGPVLGRR